MARNSKPAAELRIGTVKATIWENEVGGITRHNVTFSRRYPDGGQWKTTQSFGFSNLLSVAKLADQRHTRSLQSARPRRPARLAMTKLRKTTAPSGGGFTPVAFFSGRLSCRDDGSSFQRRSVRGVSAGTLTLGRAANGRHSTI